eukprot:125134-Chlamydomonas_euryale.AAC.1
MLTQSGSLPSTSPSQSSSSPSEQSTSTWKRTRQNEREPPPDPHGPATSTTLRRLLATVPAVHTALECVLVWDVIVVPPRVNAVRDKPSVRALGGVVIGGPIRSDLLLVGGEGAAAQSGVLCTA